MMKVHTTELPGVKIIEPRIFGDARGYFVETFHAERYAETVGISETFVQDNLSRSVRGVLRGLHAQKHYPQGKLVRVSRGAVFDVAVDIDPLSPTIKSNCGYHLDMRMASLCFLISAIFNTSAPNCIIRKTRLASSGMIPTSA